MERRACSAEHADMLRVLATIPTLMPSIESQSSDSERGTQAVSLEEVGALIEKARELAVAYYALTGKPLGITGEVGEYEAARLLGLNLMSARCPDFDAIDADGRRLQIKARRLATDKPLGGQRISTIKTNAIFDAVVLVILDWAYAPLSIWEASRTAVIAALAKPGSKARNERGALSVSAFKRVSGCRQIWHR